MDYDISTYFQQIWVQERTSPHNWHLTVNTFPSSADTYCGLKNWRITQFGTANLPVVIEGMKCPICRIYWQEPEYDPRKDYEWHNKYMFWKRKEVNKKKIKNGI